MNKKLKFLFIWIILHYSNAQKCSIVGDKQNISQSALCTNVNSMNEIVDEIKNTPAWKSIQIVNKAPVVEFTNKAINIPYLHLIHTLDLSRAGFLKFEENGFSAYDSLKNLDISDTGIAEVKVTWFSKKTIEVLNVSRNKIKDLRREHFKYFPKLKSFNASYNDMKTLEANSFLDTKKIETIALNYNHLQSVHFENLDNLKYLNLRNNFLNVVAGNYLRMPILETLDLAENLIAGVGDRWLETLENLKHVNFSNNKIPFVGEWTFGGGEKTKLAELDLSHNLITIIYPICFSHLPLLTFLDISHNKITDLYVKNFASLQILQTLILSNNRIEKIQPISFEALLQLRLLDLSRNKLKAFSFDYFGGKFIENRLRKINLSYNELSKFDEPLFNILKNLVSINVSFNKLTTLPDGIFRNNLNLIEIVLDNNEISYLPPSFLDNLKSLEVFSIQNNRMTFIPDITSLNKLRMLSIGNNPMQCICMRELLIWTRTNNCKFVVEKSNPNHPDCVVIPEAKCIKNKATIETYKIYDSFIDGKTL